MLLVASCFRNWIKFWQYKQARLARLINLSLVNKGKLTMPMSFSGRRGGLVVSELDSGLRGLGLSPGRVIVLCSWARHFTFTVPLSPPRSINGYR